MKKNKTIYIYSSFPILNIGHYFSKQAIRPIKFEQKLNKKTLLPIKSGFPKSFLLKVEHELSLKENVHIYSSFLNENDYSPIRDISNKMGANMIFVYLETSMENLFDMYKSKNGPLPYNEFCDEYIESFSIPYKNIEKLIFEQIT